MLRYLISILHNIITTYFVFSLKVVAKPEQKEAEPQAKTSSSDLKVKYCIVYIAHENILIFIVCT